MAVDYTDKRRVGVFKEFVPSPILVILNNNGDLCCFSFIKPDEKIHPKIQEPKKLTFCSKTEDQKESLPEISCGLNNETKISNTWDLPFSDVLLRRDGKEFKLHKFVIIRSGRLETLLKDSRDGSITCWIKERTLKFLYGEEIEISTIVELGELFREAVLFDIHSLRQYCLSKIKQMVNDDNVITALRCIKDSQAKMYFLKIIFESEEKNDLLKSLNKEELLDYIEFLESDDSDKIDELKNWTSEELYRIHLTEIFKTKKYSDIVLISNDNQEMQAHAFIVQQIFKFKELLEKGEKKIHIDLHSKVLFPLIEYLYTKTCELPTNVHDLIELIHLEEPQELFEQAIEKLKMEFDFTKPDQIKKFISENNINEKEKMKLLHIVAKQLSEDDIVNMLINFMLS